MYKKMMSLFMIVILIVSLSACGGGNKNTGQNQNEDIISYEETEIGVNSGLMWPDGSRVNSKNQLVVFDRGNGSDSGFVTLNQDGTPIGNSKVSFEGNVRAFDLDEAGNIYVVTAGIDNSQRLSIINPQGDILKTVELGSFAGITGPGMGDMGITDIAVDSKGNIYLANSSESIQVLNKEGETVTAFGSQGYVSLDIDSDDNIIALNSNTGKSAIEKLEASTGNSIWSVELATASDGILNIMGLNKIRSSNEGIYHITSQSITKYDSDGKLVDTIIDFRYYGILASGYNISDMALDAEGNIYITTSSAPAGMLRINSAASTSESIKYELYRYSKVSGNNVRKKEVITISVPASNRGLEIAASKFQKENPGYRIEVQTYPSDDYETYVKNLNTQILSGKGPDIISVAGLSYENYISKNILADLSEMIAKDKSFDISKYYTNILDALKYNGKLYVMPTSFTFNVLMANQKILDEELISIDDSRWTWNDFKAAAEKVSKGNRSAMPSVSSSDLLNLFTNDSYSDYIDAGTKTVNFTSQTFTDLLNTVKAFSEGNLTDSNIKNDMISVLEAAGREALVFYPFSINDYNMYSFMKSAFNEELSLYNMPSAGGNGGTFTSNSMYGINRNSQYKDQSWELLKILLSDEIQTLSSQGGAATGSSAVNAVGGFSINKSAQQMKAQQTIEVTQSGAMKINISSGNGSLTISPSPLTQGDIDYINTFIEGLNTYANKDVNISGIVQDETRNFFSGGKSVEETAKLIQDRVDTYIRE